jgi:hypothetical protein
LNAPRIGRELTFSSALTDYTIPPSTILDIVPAPSAEFIYNYTLFNPNSTKWAITFNQTLGVSSERNIQYQLWCNFTNTQNVSALVSDPFGNEVLSMTRAIDEAIISYVNDPTSLGVNATIDVSLKDWPLIPSLTLSDTVVQQLGPVFFFCSEMVIFINVISLIASEKDLKLRHGMELMGLKPAVYWLSQFLSNSLLVAVNALATSIFGLIFRFEAFRNCDFGVLFFTFFFFGESMIAFAFFLSTLVRDVRQAISIGIVFFIIGLVFETFVFSSQYVGYM